MTVTEKMLDAYNDAYRAVIDAAMSDYSKGATVADDAKRAGIAAVLALSPPAEDGWVLAQPEPTVGTITDIELDPSWNDFEIPNPPKEWK